MRLIVLIYVAAMASLLAACSNNAGSPLAPTPTAPAGPGRVFIHDDLGMLATIDLATAAVTLIGNTNVQLTDLAVDQSGSLYGMSFTTLYKVDSRTAGATPVGSHGIPGGNAMVFGPDGALYGAGFLDTRLYRISPATGAATSLGNTGFASGGDLAFQGGQLYLAAATNELVRVNLNNLQLTTAVGPFGVPNVFGLVAGADGKLYGAADQRIFLVDSTTGATRNPISFAGGGLGSAGGQAILF